MAFLLAEEINSNKNSAPSESPRAPNSLASFIPTALQEIKDSPSKEDHSKQVANDAFTAPPVSNQHQSGGVPGATSQDILLASEKSPRPMAPNRSLSSSFSEAVSWLS